MPFQMTNRPVWIARGVLAANATAGSGETAPPGSGATITILDTTAGGNTTPMPFSRYVLHIDSSADSAANGVTFEGSTNNGATWTTMQAAQTYLTASGPVDYDALATMPQVRIKYANSAAVLTRWNMSLEGILGDRSKGT